MDTPTLNAYDRDPGSFAEDWETQPPPSDLHATVRRFFIQGGATADVGCGSGRDAAWLAANGYPAEGFDASDGLLREARRRHPRIAFAAATLPELAGIADSSFANVLCETVIMHLAPESVAPAVTRLLSILRAGGVLYLSWRVTEGQDRRDEHGRLYASFAPERVLRALEGTELLLDEQAGSVSSGKLIRRIVVRKPAAIG
ncbi:MAG: class I SAM-dependent methyltransferase [Alphaproteobacteria bacterium]|nr:class I SAM-dependent methyltransferase [Alphaproteobacteria bacterium]